jgi:DNA-directed RNA polymerase specialized sigma24 family protein
MRQESEQRLSSSRTIGARPFFRAPVATPPRRAAGGGSDGATLDRDAWSRLLAFLELTHADGPGTGYERVHDRLVRFFAGKGTTHAEELADATLDRVARKLSQGRAPDIRNPIGYVLGVARLVWLESVKLEVARRHRLDNYAATRPDAGELRQTELNVALLDRCLAELSTEERALLIHYYEGRGQARIETRQALVRNLGLNPGLLRTRVHRLRAQLGRRVSELQSSALGELLPVAAPTV